MEWKFEFTSSAFGTIQIEEPIGWADITVNLKRDLVVHGLTFEYAVGLKFIDNAYDYLKTAYNTLGIDQYIELKVSLKCSETDAFEQFYLGKMFMGKLVFNCNDYCFVEAPIEPSGCQMTFKNRIDQKIELAACKDIDNNTLPCYAGLDIDLTIKPKLIKQNSIGIIENHFDSCISYKSTLTAGTGCEYHEKFVFIEPRIDSFTLSEIQQTNQLLGTISESKENVTTFIKPKYAGTYKIDVKINCGVQAFFYLPVVVSNVTCGCTGNSQISFPSGNLTNNSCLAGAWFSGTSPLNNEIFLKDVKVDFFIEVNGNTELLVNLHNTNSGCVEVLNDTYCINVTKTLTLNANDEVKMFLMVDCNTELNRTIGLTTDFSKVFGYTQDVSSVTCTNTKISASSEVLLPPTQARTHAINEALSRSVEGITNDCLRVKSDYFGRTDSQPYTSSIDGCGSLEVITNGLYLRQFPNDKVRYAVSFKELFDGLNGIHNLGYGIESDLNRSGYEWLRVEPMQYWYDANTTIMSCDNIPNLKRRVMTEWYLSIFGFGFEKWEVEQTSGLDEFNVKREYRSTLKEIKRNLNVMSKFIASGYSLEFTRAEKYIADTTKDFRFDNDTFIICVKRGNTQLEVEQGADCLDVPNVNNLIDPTTVYNSRISPNRNLLRWLPFLLGNYYPNYTTGNFQLNTSEGNFKAEMELINGCINEAGLLSEGEDISTSDAVNTLLPIFKFETVEFEYPMSFSEYKIIKNNPKGIIEFRCNDSQAFERGFIHSIQYKPNQGLATITLIPKF